MNKDDSSTVIYRLEKSKRKSIAIQISSKGEVIVKAPYRISTREITNCIEKHRHWIQQHQQEQQKKWQKQQAFCVQYGDTLILQGKEILLKESKGKNASYDSKAFYIPSGLNANDRLVQVIHLYQLAAEQVLQEKTAYYSHIMGLYPNKIRVGSANTRWGSCSGKKNINFTWKLIMAREQAINYVVIHELAHLKEMNHSSRFWQIIHNIMPAYKKEIEYLKQLQNQLAVQNWDAKS